METATAAQHHSLSCWGCMSKIAARGVAVIPVGGLRLSTCALGGSAAADAWPEPLVITMGPLTIGPLEPLPLPGPPPPLLPEEAPGELPPSAFALFGPPPPLLPEDAPGELPP